MDLWNGRLSEIEIHGKYSIQLNQFWLDRLANAKDDDDVLLEELWRYGILFSLSKIGRWWYDTG